MWIPITAPWLVSFLIKKCSKPLTFLLLSELFLVPLNPVWDEENQLYTTFQNVFTTWINGTRIFFCFVFYFFPSDCYNMHWFFVHCWELSWCLKRSIIITKSSLSWMEIGSLEPIVLDCFSPCASLHIYYIEFHLSSYCLLYTMTFLPSSLQSAFIFITLNNLASSLVSLFSILFHFCILWVQQTQQRSLWSMAFLHCKAQPFIPSFCFLPVNL